MVRVHLLPAHAEKKTDGFFRDWGLDVPTKRDDTRAAALVKHVLFPHHRWTGLFGPVELGFFGTDFQWKAMQKMNKIAPGKTITYADLARAGGVAGAARAAGSVCARNPLPFLVPCHRILAGNGGLGGYGFGTALKRQLLDWEA